MGAMQPGQLQTPSSGQPYNYFGGQTNGYSGFGPVAGMPNYFAAAPATGAMPSVSASVPALATAAAPTPAPAPVPAVAPAGAGAPVIHPNTILPGNNSLGNIWNQGSPPGALYTLPGVP